MTSKINVIAKFVSVLCFAVLALSVSASEEPRWRIVIYNPLNGGVVAVTPEGIEQTWTFPEGYTFVALSPNEDIALLTDSALVNTEGARPTVQSIVAFDLVTGECCQPFITQETLSGHFDLPEGAEYHIEFSYLIDRGFDDTGAFFAFDVSSYWEEDGRFYDALAVMDVATGELLGDWTQVIASEFVGWIDDRVLFRQDYNLTSDNILPYYEMANLLEWNPKTDEVVVSALTSVRFLSDLNTVYYLPERLETGEYVTASMSRDKAGDHQFLSTDYTHAGETFMVWVDSITIREYWMFGGEAERGRWISDGRYIFNETLGDKFSSDFPECNRVEILWRNGEIDSHEVSCYEQFLAGTEDGWVSFNPQSGTSHLVEYTYRDGVLERRKLFPFRAYFEVPLLVLIAPKLGGSLGDIRGFPIRVPLTSAG